MEELIAWILVVIALLVVLQFTLGYVLIGLYWFVAVVASLFISSLDTLFSASLVPGLPWLMWVIWGALIGAALAFWTIAPIFGQRRRRALILAAPFGLMLLIALARAMVK